MSNTLQEVRNHIQEIKAYKKGVLSCQVPATEAKTVALLLQYLDSVHSQLAAKEAEYLIEEDKKSKKPRLEKKEAPYEK